MSQLDVSDGIKVTNVPMQHYEVLKELAECYVALDDYGRARQCYRDAARIEPGQAGPHVGLGVVAIQTGQIDVARDAFEIAIQIDAGCAEAYGGLAMVYQQSGDFAAAFDMHLKCLELDTDNLVALLGLFQTSCQMGTFSKVIHYLEVYLEKHPGDTSVLFCLATLYARDGEFEPARQCLLTVLALEPGKVEAERLLSDVEKRLAGMPLGGTVGR